MKRYVSVWLNFVERLGDYTCRWMHEEITRPVQGQYICLQCMRKHSVNF
jgi:hypothetical protein